MIDLFYFDKVLKVSDIKNLHKLKRYKVWVDITNCTKEEAELLRKQCNLHALTVEDLTKQGTRIKIEEFPHYMFCVFYGLKKEKSTVLQELDFVIAKNILITNHKTEVSTFTKLKNNKEKLTRLFQKGTDFIFHHVLDQEVDNFFPVLELIDDKIEAIEENVTQNPRPELLKKILALKREIVIIKKSTLPQREKIGFLAKNQNSFISKNAVPYFRDVYDHAIRVSDTIENYREAVSGTFDAYMSAVSNNMNEVMKTLSIIATIALPLGVISGIYGTNFLVLPGQHYPYGFWVMLGGMFSIIAFMMYMFKKRSWF